MIEKNHPPIKYGNTGVLMVNLGTPDSTNWFDIRKYLKEFLSDRRVIEVNPLIWQIILNLFILNFRPSKTAKAYKEIWMKDENISPLLYYTKKQSEKVSNSLSKENIIIDFAMRYGNPSIKSKIHKLHKIGCENLVILPLYPQYAAATTATVCDEVYRTLMKMRWQPSLKIIPHYESDVLYIDALVESGTYIAIILGLVVGGVAVSIGKDNDYPLALMLLSMAIIGYFFSKKIPATEPTDPNLKINWNIVSEIRKIIGFSRQEKDIFIFIIGISWFWFRVNKKNSK